tara:strand:- start:298 stop:972 length:675 start_codon:yes stop_codon:yes gene_type:complete
MSYKIISRKELLMDSLQGFFNDDIANIAKIIPILNNNRNISLRIIDWFVTNYSKKHNISYLINTATKEIVDKKEPYDPLLCKEFVVYLNYKLQLKAYSKDQFDPFCRKSRIDFYYDTTNVKNYVIKNVPDSEETIDYLDRNTGSYFTTTSGQLNFFRWIIKNNIVDYITTNVKNIEEDMNFCYKKQYKKSKKNCKTQRKKRHELSVSGSKSLSKSNVKIILTFN